MKPSMLGALFLSGCMTWQGPPPPCGKLGPRGNYAIGRYESGFFGSCTPLAQLALTPGGARLPLYIEPNRNDPPAYATIRTRDPAIARLDERILITDDVGETELELVAADGQVLESAPVVVGQPTQVDWVDAPRGRAAVVASGARLRIDVRALRNGTALAGAGGGSATGTPGLEVVTQPNDSPSGNLNEAPTFIEVRGTAGTHVVTWQLGTLAATLPLEVLDESAVDRLEATPPALSARLGQGMQVTVVARRADGTALPGALCAWSQPSDKPAPRGSAATTLTRQGITYTLESVVGEWTARCTIGAQQLDIPISVQP